MTNVDKREGIPLLLEHSKKNSTGGRLNVNMGMQRVRVTAEERSCLERVYTV